MAHGDAREGKWRENWRMEWLASTLILPRNMVHPALLPLMRTLWMPVVDWTDVPPDLNGLVRFAERRNLVSARAPSHFKRSLLYNLCVCRLRHPACDAHAPYCHLWSAPLYIFPRYLINGTVFEKQLLNIKYVFRVSLQTLSEILFIIRRKERDMIENVHWSTCKVPVILVRF